MSKFDYLRFGVGLLTGNLLVNCFIFLAEQRVGMAIYEGCMCAVSVYVATQLTDES